MGGISSTQFTKLLVCVQLWVGVWNDIIADKLFQSNNETI